MDYMEQNVLLLQEISQQQLRRGPIVAKSLGDITVVTALGSYESGILGKRLYLALKASPGGIRRRVDQVAREVATIRTLERDYPHLAGEVPLVHGCLFRGSEALGVLTEDFTEGGRHPIEEMTNKYRELTFPKDQYPEIKDEFGRPLREPHISTVCFMVDGRRRIGDFDSLVFAVASHDLVNDTLRRSDELKVTIDYLL